MRVRDADEFVNIRLVFAEDESDEETAAATEAAGEDCFMGIPPLTVMPVYRRCMYRRASAGEEQ